MWPLDIHVITPYFGGSSLYFAHFWENLPTKISEFPAISYTSPFLEFKVSLPQFENFLLCLIILPIWERKSPYLSFQMYHTYAPRSFKCCVFRLLATDFKFEDIKLLQNEFSKPRYVTLNASIPVWDRIHQNSRVCRTFLPGIYTI